MVWAGVDGRVYVERGESASLAGRPASHVARWGRGTARASCGGRCLQSNVALGSGGKGRVEGATSR